MPSNTIFFIEILRQWVVLAVLTLLFSIGYWLAWTDFKPRKFTLHVWKLESTPRLHKSQATKRAFTSRELGLDSIQETANLSPAAQRTIRMEEQMRYFSNSSPDRAARIIKNWLNDS